MITQIDRPTVRLISDRIMEALKTVSDELGIQFNYKGGTFSPNNCTLKIEASVRAPDGTVIDREREAFKRSAFIFGLNPEMLDKTFVSNGEEFRIVGLSPRKSKYPVIAMNTGNQKKYKFTPAAIKNLSTLAPIPA